MTMNISSLRHPPFSEFAIPKKALLLIFHPLGASVRLHPNLIPQKIDRNRFGALGNYHHEISTRDSL